MLLLNKKKIAGMLVSRMGSDGKDLPPEEPKEHLEPDHEELHVLAGEVRKALESKSDAQLAEALMTFFQHCDLDTDEY